MSKDVADRREEIDRVFGRALPLIEIALVSQYGLPSDEAKDVEQSLYEWFHGFARRPGSPRSGEGLRPHLLLMACQAGHVYWCGRMAEESSGNDGVKRALTLGPQQIAIELETSAAGPDDRKRDYEPKAPGEDKSL